MAGRKNPILDTATTLGKLVGFLGVSVLCGLLVAGLMGPAVAATGSTASAGVDAFNNLPADFPDDLKDVNPAQSTKVLANDGSVMATIYAVNRTPVNADQIAPVMGQAAVSIEDSRFYEHGGVDPQGIARALFASVNGSRQGASTITQQYVNNLLIQKLVASGQTDEVKLGTDKGVGDKLKEMRLAIALEKKYSKDEILTNYLNIVNFANGNYGVQAAAKYYFNEDAKDLSLSQAALLAGIVNSPGYYDPVQHPDHAKERRDQVLDLMLQQKKIDQKQHDDAVAQPVTVQQNQVPNGCVAASQAPYFCNYVSHVLMNDDKLLPQFKDRGDMLKQAGLTVKTTLDSRLQGPLQDQVNATVPADNNPDKVGHSMVTVEPGTGKVLAMAQNTQYNAAEGQWSDDYNFNVDSVDANGQSLGGAGGFATGSTMKPFTFAEWLNEDHTVNEQVNGTVRRYPVGFPWKNSCGTTTGYYDSSPAGQAAGASPDLQNAEEGFYRTGTALFGLQQSLNTFTFAEAAKLDFCGIQKTMSAAGIHNGRDGKSPYNMSNSSNVIGSDPVSPMVMANAFATFASGGTYCEPNAIESITDSSGKALPVPDHSCKKDSINPDVASGTMVALQAVLNGGSGYQIPLRVPAGAKTGTTNISEQTWTVGVTKGLATASWVGNPDQGNRSLNGIPINGVVKSYVDGAGVAGHSWQGYMNQVAGFYDTSGFPAPPAKIMGGGAPPKQAPAPAPKNNDNQNNNQDAPKPEDNKPPAGNNPPNPAPNPEPSKKG